ncbi:MAG: two-component sensor histidine kinase [Lachnospiraceae bacterium]|nr:two-component sensor histidine kinase [Lachnospiraceae bacterium]
MKKKINARLVFLSILAIFSTMLCITLVYYDLFGKQIMANLEIYSNFIREYDTIDEIMAAGDRNSQDGVRVTLIEKDGSVVYDSATDSETMENHSDRPEILSAYENGEGTDIRISKTLDQSTYYYAVRLEDGMVLRVSEEAENIFSFFFSAIPTLLVIAGLLTIISLIFAQVLTDNLVEPIEKLAEHLDDGENITYYEELEPFIHMIRKQHQDLRHSANMRQEFTANVSHELKTPLTSISGYAELIEAGMGTEEDTRRFAAGIHKSATRLLTLINDIIRLAELDVSKGELDLERINLLVMVNACAEMLQISAQKHNVTISVEGEDCYIMGNRTMIDELIYNLVDNAIRYNYENGKVYVKVGHEGEKVALIVSDTGIGISKEHQERIFERFYRVDKSRSKSTGGTGLGLAIVKHILVSHDAKLELTSEPDKGTTMKIIFEE